MEVEIFILLFVLILFSLKAEVFSICVLLQVSPLADFTYFEILLQLMNRKEYLTMAFKVLGANEPVNQLFVFN